MTEPATVPRRFPWRRVLLGMLALVLAGAVWFGVKEGKPRAPLPTRWVGFEPGQDGTSIVGVVTVTNQSHRTFSLEMRGTGKVWTASAVKLCTVQFMGLHWPGDYDVWAPPPAPFKQFVAVPPATEWRITVPLPQDGRTGHVAIRFGERPRPLSKFAVWLRSLSSRKPESRPHEFLQLMEETIQCPRVRPDGTIEPGRVLPKETR